MEINTGVTPEYQRAEKAALRLIARAEQCGAGLARKLEKRGIEAACAGAVISRLTELKLVDDRRFARLWVESRLRLSRSPRRLLVSLCGRGIDRDDAEAALKAVLDEEKELAMLTRFVERHSRKNGCKGEKSDHIPARSPVTSGRADKRSGAGPLKYLLKSEGFSPRVIQRLFGEEQ